MLCYVLGNHVLAYFITINKTKLQIIHTLYASLAFLKSGSFFKSS